MEHHFFWIWLQYGFGENFSNRAEYSQQEKNTVQEMKITIFKEFGLQMLHSTAFFTRCKFMKYPLAYPTRLQT
jgi:hypothetical protein